MFYIQDLFRFRLKENAGAAIQSCVVKEQYLPSRGAKASGYRYTEKDTLPADGKTPPDLVSDHVEGLGLDRVYEAVLCRFWAIVVLMEP